MLSLDILNSLIFCCFTLLFFTECFEVSQTLTFTVARFWNYSSKMCHSTQSGYKPKFIYIKIPLHRYPVYAIWKKINSLNEAVTWQELQIHCLPEVFLFSFSCTHPRGLDVFWALLHPFFEIYCLVSYWDAFKYRTHPL